MGVAYSHRFFRNSAVIAANDETLLVSLLTVFREPYSIHIACLTGRYIRAKIAGGGLSAECILPSHTIFYRCWERGGKCWEKRIFLWGKYFSVYREKKKICFAGNILLNKRSFLGKDSRAGIRCGGGDRTYTGMSIDLVGEIVALLVFCATFVLP